METKRKSRGWGRFTALFRGRRETSKQASRGGVLNLHGVRGNPTLHFPALFGIKCKDVRNIDEEEMAERGGRL